MKNCFAIAESGNADALESALKDGASVESPGDRGDHALNAAAGNGHLACVKILLAHRAQVDHANEGGATPLMAASHGGHAHVVETLVAAGADVERMNGAGVTPLFAALSSTSIDAPTSFAVVRALLAGKANANQPTRSGRLPLSKAKDAATADALVAAGASVDAKDSSGKTALHHAASDGNGALVAALCARGASADALDEDGATPLACGVGALLKADAIDAVRTLVAATKQRAAKGYRGQTALSVAAENGRVDAVELLLGAGEELEVGDAASMTPLMWAAYENHAAVVTRLLEAGANRDARDRNGLTAREQVEKKIADDAAAPPKKPSRLRRAPAEPKDRTQVLEILKR
jgi:ankyrin repeat protein